MRTDDLSQRTMRNLRAYFKKQTEHRPSAEMYASLEDIANTLSDMAQGRAARKVYLSSLDPGVGKTATISSFVDELLVGTEHDHVGVLICVARLDEIRTLVERMAIPHEMLAVYTSDPELNALGHAEPSAGRVLFTTQQMVEKRLTGWAGGSFERCTHFFYRGKPRAVRIWDETWLPGEGVCVSRYAISNLLQLLVHGNYKALADSMEDLFTRIRNLPDGTRETLPDFAQHADLNDLLELVDRPRDNDEKKYQERRREELAALWYLSGKTVVVRRDGKDGNTVLNYRETLPEDLAPLLVLDASGRVRETYAEMERGRSNIVRLKTAAKRYDRLTVNVWKTGGGKGSFAKGEHRAQELIDGIASTINTKPDKEWLVVHHLPNKHTVDVAAGVQALLTGDKNKVHFITWGRHMATNTYAHVKNVLLAGTLFYRPSQYEALGRLAAGLKPGQGDYPQEALRRMVAGECRHGILQALCRASVRRCDGEQAHECNAYIIASVQTGIPDALPLLFPGCSVKVWKPIKRALRGKVKEAVDYLRDRFANPGTALVKFAEVQKALGIKNAGTFKNDIRQHEDLQAELAEMGLAEWGKGIRFTAWKRVEAADFGF